ncbi:MAG: alpha/beta fold hydrolase [Bacteroidota bacterium]
MWKRAVPILLLLLSACTGQAETEPVAADPVFAPGSTVDFAFESNGLTLSGVFDTPAAPQSEALILFVHGYGGTDIRARNTFADLRQRFNALGIATAVWDKPGQGQSEGTFDINQPVASSAQEVLDAANYLREVGAPGADRIGLWGVSRAGWIAPLALSQDADIDFWISVSGTTEEDNFTYLLLSNLPYEGGTAEQATRFEAEWRRGCEILRTGGSFDRYQAATQTLRANEYIRDMRGGWPNRVQYIAQQRRCKEGTCDRLDDDLCSYISINDFDAMLASLDLDVLAIFGEKDLNVDWRKTRALYQATLGQNPEASLAIASFADADHNLHVSETGSLREMRTMTAPQKSEGYYEVQLNWLLETVLDRTSPD